MKKADDQGMRQEKRDSLFLSATMTIGTIAPFTTRVRNLSAGGMMIDSDRDLMPGTSITAEVRGIGMIEGRIAWSSPGRAGVAFDKEIDPRQARTGSAPKSLPPLYQKHMPSRRPGLAIR
jgi:PilZ domain